MLMQPAPFPNPAVQPHYPAVQPRIPAVQPHAVIRPVVRPAPLPMVHHGRGGLHPGPIRGPGPVLGNHPIIVQDNDSSDDDMD